GDPAGARYPLIDGRSLRHAHAFVLLVGRNLAFEGIPGRGLRDAKGVAAPGKERFPLGPLRAGRRMRAPPPFQRSWASSGPIQRPNPPPARSSTNPSPGSQWANEKHARSSLIV
ncbi:unnamed protein product, partial [Ixodes persulcatus]